MTTRHRFTRAALAAAALLPLLLGGCGLHHRHHGGAQRPDPANPQVLVDDKGRLSVNLEPLRFYRSQGPVTITWRLPADGRYAFPKDGIVVEGLVSRAGTAAASVSEEFQCGPGAKANEFSCLNRNSRPGEYKYSVRALRDGQALPPLDPRIVNEFD